MLITLDSFCTLDKKEHYGQLLFAEDCVSPVEQDDPLLDAHMVLHILAVRSVGSPQSPQPYLSRHEVYHR